MVLHAQIATRMVRMGRDFDTLCGRRSDVYRYKFEKKSVTFIKK